MAWHNGDYSAITTLTDSDILLAAQSGQTMTATVAKIKSALGVCSSCLLSSNSTLAGTPANLTETTLNTYTLPAATLNTDGWFARATYWGTFANNGNTKTLKFKFGATSTTIIAAAVTVTWKVEALIIRTAAGNQDLVISSSIANPAVFFSEPAENLNGAVNLLITGQNGTASASDIRYEGHLIILNS